MLVRNCLSVSFILMCGIMMLSLCYHSYELIGHIFKVNLGILNIMLGRLSSARLNCAVIFSLMRHLTFQLTFPSTQCYCVDMSSLNVAFDFLD